MDGSGVEVTFVPHGFEVDVWNDCVEPPGQKRVAGYCFDFGNSYDPELLADRLAQFLADLLRDEPGWLCGGAALRSESGGA